MTPKKRTVLPGTREDIKKSLKRSQTQESTGSSKGPPTVQRQSAENGDAAAILNLQRTIGNRAVGQLLNRASQAVQRESLDEDQEPMDDNFANSSFALNTGIYPGEKSESPSPENTRPSIEAMNTLGHEVGHVENDPSSTDPANDALPQEVGQIALGQGHDPGSSQAPEEQEE